MTIGQMPPMSVFSEGVIRDAQRLKTPKIGGGSSAGDPFLDCFMGVDDAFNITDAPVLMAKAQHLFSKVSASCFLFIPLHFFLRLFFLTCAILPRIGFCQILS